MANVVRSFCTVAPATVAPLHYSNSCLMLNNASFSCSPSAASFHCQASRGIFPRTWSLRCFSDWWWMFHRPALFCVVCLMLLCFGVCVVLYSSQLGGTLSFGMSAKPFSNSTEPLRCLWEETKQATTDLYPCGEFQTMYRVIDSCPLTKIHGSLVQLQSVDDGLE